MEWKRVFVCLAVIGLLAGSGAWAAHHEGGFAKLAEAWQAAYNEGNVDAVVALYMEDGMRMPPDVPTVKGREAIKAQIVDGMEMGLAKVKIETVDMKVMDDMGFGRGTFVGMDAEGNTITKGKWANAAKMVDGKWHIQYDIFNYDMPRQAPE
jgi:ketosteroid isomerase-like protein